MLKCVYASDLHFEINGLGKCLGKWEPGDVLILAGDEVPVPYLHPDRTDPEGRAVKKAWKYLTTKVFPMYRKVLIVMGNHTHYHYVFKDTEGSFRWHMRDIPNICLLENDSILIDDVLFLGCTLWTDMNRHNPIDMMTAQEGMNDYHIIWTKKYEELPYYDRKKINEQPPRLTAEDTYQVHMKSREFLETALMDNPQRKTVVITHHCPSYHCLNPQHVSSPINAGYCSNLEGMILSQPQIKAWVYGHVHTIKEFNIGDTKVLSNCCGYYMEKCYKEFKPNKWFEV